MVLYTETHDALNIVGGGQGLEYTYDGTANCTVVCRVELGSDTRPVAGGGTYTASVFLNDRRLVPDSSVVVAADTVILIQSRELLLTPGDHLIVVVTGRPADTAVDAVTTLLDVTPLTRSDVYGEGSTAVDHDYGGTDRLTYVGPDGRGIDNATIQAFLRSDWNAGRRGSGYVRAQTSTTPRGRWFRPMLLDPGTYILLYFRQGMFGPDTTTITVS